MQATIGKTQEYISRITRFVETNRTFRKAWRTIEISAAAIPLLFILSSFGLQFAHPGYNAFQDAISFLVWGPFGWGLTICFYMLAASMVVLVIKLFIRAKNRVRSTIGISLFALVVIGLVLIGANPSDPPGAAMTQEGLIHINTVAAIIFMFPAVCFIMAPDMHRFFSRKWLKMYTWASGVTALVFIAGIAVLFLGNFGWMGAAERLIFFNSLVWVQVMSLVSL